MNKRTTVISVGIGAVALALIVFALFPTAPRVDPYVVQMEQEIALYTGQVDSMTNVVDGMNDRIDAIRTQLDTARTSNKTLVNALQRVTGELKEYQKLYGEQRELNKKLASEIQQVRADKNAAIADKVIALAQVDLMRTQMYSVHRELYTKTIRIGRLESNLETALNQVDALKETMVSILVYAGTEDDLKKAGYLKAWRPALFSKDYRILNFPEMSNSALAATVQQVALNSPLTLSGELEALADRHGKLEKGKEFEIQKADGQFQITFIEPTLRGQRILAVLKK
ncbi:MAG: hypothetical protein O3B73_13120 [bacterium]|nr:hypothetical protein [bacterium]